MPYDERDKKTGKFTETYSKEDILNAVNELSGSASTQEVADKVGCAYRTAYQKLTQLEEENLVNSRKVANARLWQAQSEN
jgi:predicted ArsR family transcriptional regulator